MIARRLTEAEWANLQGSVPANVRHKAEKALGTSEVIFARAFLAGEVAVLVSKTASPSIVINTRGGVWEARVSR